MKPLLYRKVKTFFQNNCKSFEALLYFINYLTLAPKLSSKPNLSLNKKPEQLKTYLWHTF